jgi:poly(A) polymerase
VSDADRDRESLPNAREAAAEIARVLRAHGHIAYFAGGCVRDQLLGQEPKDFDVATTATPAEIQSLFRRTHGVGQAFGVVLVVMLGHSIEVTTFRAEGKYSDSRRPDEIRYAGPEEDARRRDFTINGLFQDPASAAIIDLVGGQEDLKSGVIRAIGDPLARLREDRLRMLRAVRFAARFGFAIDPETEAAIRENPSSLDGVSRARIGLEVEAMLEHSSRARAAQLMQELSLDAVVLREENLNADLPRLRALSAEIHFGDALAAWWLDRRDEDSQPFQSSRQWRDALILSNHVTDRLLAVLEIHDQLKKRWGQMTVAEKKRIAARMAFSQALRIFSAANPQPGATIEAQVQELAREGLAPAPFIDGQTLLDQGLKPGPAFSRILQAVYDAQLEGRVLNHQEAAQLARNLALGP